LPQKFYDVVGVRAASRAIEIGSGFKNHTTDILRMKKLLENTPPATQGESGDKATYNVCCLGKDYGLSPDVFFELLCEWNERCSPPWQLEDLRTKMLNAYSYSHNKAGSHAIENMFTAIEQTFLNEEQAQKQAEEILDWQNELQVNKNGGYKTTLKNAVLFMKHDEHLKGRIAFNEFSYKKFWIKKPFWITNGRREWTDEDAIQIRYIFNNNNFDVGTNLVEEASVIISSNNRFHPVKDWFNNNCKWDGINRLDTFFNKYCGTDLNKYTSSLARKMFCAVVARVFNPGCKFDMVPIFVGEKGIGKSSLIEAISIKKEWFCNNIGDITDTKELVPQSNGKLIIEWQELSMYNKLDINSVKAFASTQVDRVRRAHARNSEDYPRQFIVIATTNQDKFLLDETGERRITPIEIKKVDLEAVKKDICLLYAEAIQLYLKGEKLYFDETDVIEIYNKECDKRFRNDEIEEIIVEWLENIPQDIQHFCTKYKLQVSDVIIHCFKETPAKARGLSNRISNVLRRLGYNRQSFRTKNGKVKQGFVKKF
jgi:predicted P-loop ATPase